MKNDVIGISGISGAGKTTLAKKLSEDLNAACLFWDDFDAISKSPENYVEWYENGCDYHEFDYVALSNILYELKMGKAVVHPIFAKKLEPTKYIIIDAPNGRLHQQTGKFIDHCIHIHTPLDVALIRRTIRDFKEPNKTKEEVLDDLSYYLNYSRPLFFDKELLELSDFIIDGCLPIEEQIKKIKLNLNI